MTEVLAIFLIAAVAGVWAWLQIRTGHQPHICQGPGTCSKRPDGHRCDGCPRARSSMGD
jgi:hypothetical protein